MMSDKDYYLSMLMDDLSFQARAIWDSFLLSVMGPGHVDDDRYALAAALRAAAKQLCHPQSASTLHALADELEGIKYGTYRCNL